MEELCAAKDMYFVWEATCGKILTLDQLKRRGLTFANKFFLSQEWEETVDHLLLHCTKTRVLWDLLFSVFGVSWFISSSVQDTLLGGRGSFVAKDRRRAWATGPLCILWAVWKTKIGIVFKNEAFSLQKLKHFFVHLLWSKTK